VYLKNSLKFYKPTTYVVRGFPPEMYVSYSGVTLFATVLFVIKIKRVVMRSPDYIIH